MAFPLRILFLLCTHMHSMQDSPWKPLFQVNPIWVNTTMSSNINNHKKINDHYFYVHGTKFHILKNAFAISFTSWCQHIKWYTMVVVLAAKFLASCPLSDSWFHHPRVLTCYSCHDSRMKANHEPLAQEWTFKKSCDILSQAQPSIWKTHHARNITWQHFLLLLQSNNFRIMWTSPCTLTFWCQN